MVSWFESVLDDLTSDLQSFQRLTDQINVTMGSAALPQSISDDCQAIADDLDTLFDAISAFQRERRNKGSLDPRLPQLRTRCLNLLTQSEEANGNISRFDNQIKGAIVELRHPPQQTTKTDEVRSQLTQIHRSLEDLISSNHLIPQHERLIIELNDSLVESMSSFHQSILAAFGAEFDQLRQATERFQQDAVTKRLSARESMKLLGEVQTSIGQDTTTTQHQDLTISPLNQLTQQATHVSGSVASVNVTAPTHQTHSHCLTLLCRISISPCT
jgi:hypothetical protein